MRFLRGPLDPVAAAGARLVVAVLRLVYAVLKLLPERDEVVLVSRLYAHTSQDFRRLREELQRQSPGTEVVVLNHRNVNPLRVPGQMLVEMYHLAVARAAILDSYIAVVSVLRHHRRLTVVQVWHALGAVKRFGLAALEADEGRGPALAGVMRMHQGYDWVLTGGPRMVVPFSEAFGVPETTVLPIGTPRVDLLLDPASNARKRDRIRATFPELGEKPVVLYAPTFRLGVPVQVDELLDALGPDEFDVVVTLHPLDRRDFSDRPGVFQSPRFTTLDWLAVADHVVTDYSAIVFDAAVIGTPLYFYAYDLDEYEERRGLFLDYEHEMPGPVCRHAKDVVAAVHDSAGSRARVAAFRDRYVAASDGGCTRRVVQLALGTAPADLR